uniref:Uncharacterized protein n=1 Tax=Chrysotila carterae TaxID=13221 RepID=A0A7S4ERL6_CHRCT
MLGPDASQEEKQLQEALVHGRVHYWENNFGQDFFFYLSNNHILLSVICAHPLHPYNKIRRLLVLLNSLSFAFFIVAACTVVAPNEAIQSLLIGVVGTVLQLAWDIPTSMLGTCACANAKCLPRRLADACRTASLVLVSCHLCMGLVFFILGVALVNAVRGAEPDHIVHDFVESKLTAFASAVPTMLVIFAILRHCEMQAEAKSMI